jgi:glycosyltransferase involved in cell wall biosynthesis
VAPVSQASELGLTGQSIVCFSKDWTEDPTSNNHVLGLLAQNNRVLWLNSISTRTPKLSSGRDLAKIRRKLAAALRGARQVRPNLWVATPLVLPLPHNPVATRLNRWILRATVGLLRRRLGMREFQLWSFLPSAAEYFGTLGESLSVYYCTDEWSLFTGMDRERMAAADREICRRADVVFATATSLLEKREPLNREAHLATHGVDHALFSQALLDETQVPEEIASLPKPVLGFYGLLEDWVDQELLAHLAQAHPEWSLVLVGKECVDFSLLKALPNVHLLGRKPHSELPAYCKGFSVGLIPYLLTDRIRTVNPIKLREYLCAGLPVVSTPLPEVLPYGHLCSVAGDKETFLRAVEGALASDTPALHRQRSEAMRAETWERKVRELGTTVARVRHRKQDERLA